MARRAPAPSSNPMIGFTVNTTLGPIRVAGREGGCWNITAPWGGWSYCGWESEVRGFIDRKIKEASKAEVGVTFA